MLGRTAGNRISMDVANEGLNRGPADRCDPGQAELPHVVRLLRSADAHFRGLGFGRPDHSRGQVAQ
jgi:hypothetical protein